MKKIRTLRNCHQNFFHECNMQGISQMCPLMEVQWDRRLQKQLRNLLLRRKFAFTIAKLYLSRGIFFIMFSLLFCPRQLTVLKLFGILFSFRRWKAEAFPPHCKMTKSKDWRRSMHLKLWRMDRPDCATKSTAYGRFGSSHLALTKKSHTFMISFVDLKQLDHCDLRGKQTPSNSEGNWKSLMCDWHLWPHETFFRQSLRVLESNQQ